MPNREKRMVDFFRGTGHPFISVHQNRNELCRCGSGRKAKKCCGCEKRYAESKPKQPKI